MGAERQNDMYVYNDLGMRMGRYSLKLAISAVVVGASCWDDIMPCRYSNFTTNILWSIHFVDSKLPMNVTRS